MPSLFDVENLVRVNRSLPLHLAVSKESPSFPVVCAIIEAYPKGLVELDDEGKRPIDR